MPTARKTATKTTLKVLHAPSLAPLKWMVHGFSTRQGGFSNAYGKSALNLGFTAHDKKATVLRNRQALISSLPRNRKGHWELVSLRQIHSDLIHFVSEAPDHTLAGDGLITNVPGLLLAVLTADCLPVIVADPKHHAVGVFHAGWRGTVKRIVEKGVGEMRRRFGSKPADLRAAIGPGIRNCCYQVGQEVRDKFETQFSYGGELFRETKERDEIHERYPLLFLTARAPGHSVLPKKIFLDLAEANRRQLLDAGVLARSISDLDECTSCKPDRFFSHRADKGVTGRMMAVVGIHA
jgi:purine-nucleoside/S-methyl-5'-thioadenosine phosphorylase / adenosine deaminase